MLAIPKIDQAMKKPRPALQHQARVSRRIPTWGRLETQAHGEVGV